MLIGALPIWAEQVKFFLSVGGAFWAAFTGFTFVKATLEETKTDVKAVKAELTSQTTAIVSAAEKQTQQLVGVREDVRMLVQAMIAPPPRARAARAARRKK
jgi:hypothetical protein